MNNIVYPVTCPLMNDKKIDEDTCFDIHMVVHGGTPKWTAPEEIYEKSNYEEICFNCKYHRYD